MELAAGKTAAHALMDHAVLVSNVHQLGVKYTPTGGVF